MKDITKDYTLDHQRSIGSQNRLTSTRMFTCEQCYGTNFRKESGRMICRKCGTVYAV